MIHDFTQQGLFDRKQKYPTAPGWKDRDTSEAAAEAIKPKADTLRQKVMTALSLRPMSTDDTADVLDEDKLAVRPRFSELSAMGLIEDTGRRTRNVSGKMAIVWRVK